MKSKSPKNIAQFKELSKDQFDALFQITESLNNAEYPELLMEKSLDMVINAINAERGLFARYNFNEKEFRIITARNLNKENIKDLTEFSSGILHQIIKNKKPMLYHDVQGDPKLSQYESVQLQKIKSIIGVPIIHNDKIWGVIIADSQTDRKEFTKDNLQFLNFFSNLISLSLDKIIKIEELEDEYQIILNKLQSTEQMPEIIGRSKPMRELAQIIHKVANTETTVLIQGESGTGKELVAHALHKLSARKKEPFLGQFCGSIPDNLLESELFGYKKGAFTGASKDKKGLLEVAAGGTFFLDEIADISPALQAKLLRVIENREIIRLGDTVVYNVDVRIIAATNKDLTELVKEGKFREDLYYRLNVFPVRLPPLKERIEDIPLLAEHFFKKQNRKITIDPAALNMLQHYSWPGNVRQLFNVLERAVIICDEGKIKREHIMIEDDDSSKQFHGSLAEIEQRILKERLNEFEGNKTLTAKSLNVSVRWVQLKLKEMGEE